MKFYTTVNVTDVKVYGTATRGEKIDVESYTFEGNYEVLKLVDYPVFKCLQRQRNIFSRNSDLRNSSVCP